MYNCPTCGQRWRNGYKCPDCDELASGSSQAPGSAPLRWWIGERCSRARKTIIVQATSRQEAQDALDRGEGTGTDVTYYDIQRAKVIREDKPNKD